ncbi:hypothetical protein Vadar_009926 [Vaccinium darrowii]|uniref:Uncharacterized protein n=1 Tax=Vaccinium darrowii TaxID=229202 RepID=A0ACB7Z3M6_9ERIC|nr:hypothetical protein Vadar_009926 [Vaccinium darrowii]
MTSSPPSLSCVLFLTLALILIAISPALTTSRKTPDDLHDQLMKTGIKITLNNIDSHGKFTKFERLHRAMNRGRSRLQKFSEIVAGKNPNISSAVHPGNNEFLMKLSIGTPPISYYAVMDTGSDLIWIQCRPCQQCFPQPTPSYDPNNSSSFSTLSCYSSLCKALQGSCDNGCLFFYYYFVDSSLFEGSLGNETFTFGNASVPNIGFGCIEDVVAGNGLNQPAAVVGLGRGPLSLVSQLGEPKFSYCLTSINETKPSTLLMGSQASVNFSSEFSKTTPLIQNPKIPTFYYVSLQGITIGGTNLPINQTTFALNANGTGGLIIDSGTSMTYLVESAFALVKNEFIFQLKLPVVEQSNSTGPDLCFELPSGVSTVEIPSLVFHFQDADLDLPTENYMITNSSTGVMCLAMGVSSSDLSIFGNIQQQNFLVVYDLLEETVSFMPTECDKF